MNIAIDISQIAYEGTGVASYTKGMVESLLRVDSENEYTFFGFSLRQVETLKNYSDHLIGLNKKVKTKFFPIPQSLGNFLWNRFHILNIETLLGNIDIYHSSDWLQLPSKIAKKVTTVHDLVVYRFPETSHPYIVETQKRRLYWVKKECDFIFCDSQATINDLIGLLHFGKEKLMTVYPGVDEIYKQQNNENKLRIRQKYGLFDEYVLFVGTDEPRKNLDRVISAFNFFLKHPLIRSRKNPIGLVVAGKEGWKRTGFEIKDNKYIKKLGVINKDDMPALYAGASVLIYPSLYEGFGLPVVEAMSCGCPVITSASGSLREVSGDASILVDPYDDKEIAVKMTQIMIDQDLRNNLIKKGLEQAKKFSWDKTAKLILQSYEKIIS